MGLLLGFILIRLTAAGADTIKRIASITAAVEICFIGLFASRAWKWCRGSGDSPKKLQPDSFVVANEMALVGPNRMTCGVPARWAKCMGAE